MHPDLEKLVSRGKIETATAEELELLPPGTFCRHKSWGAGKVVEWDRLNLKVIVDFEDKPGHALGMKFAGMSLTPITDESFLAKRHSELEEMQDLAKADPTALVKLVLSSHNSRLYLDQLEELLKGHVIPETKYKSWWESTKKKLRDDMQFVVPAKRTEPLELREENFDPSEGLIEDFREARDLKAKVKSIEVIIKDISAFKDQQVKLENLVDEISDIAKKGVKIQYVPAVELILIREELQSKLKDYTAQEEQITTAQILATNEAAIPGLFGELSLTRLRQVLKSFPDAFGEDEYVDKMLGLISETNLRSIAEICNYLSSADEKDAVIAHMENGLQQRSLSSDALAWICRERKGLAETIFNPVLSLSVMSSLESDQLNDEGAVRSANRLRDLVGDDKALIPDLIEGANINTIRNFASRLVTSASFDELTRKSLMARVIKMHPEIQDLLSGRTEVKEEMLIVSEESLKVKQADFDKLVKEEIPQNREDIKIARSYGDLRENFEYKSAKEYQRILMKRQDDWERDLKLAQTTDFSNADTDAVSIGTIVELDPVDGKGDKLTYSILGAWDSDPDKGIIAYLSERGSQILEKKVGDEVNFHSAEGTEKSYRVSAIKAYKS
ncbi:GreA/GreB family elongation factor [Verrucomicrobiales bacterium]|nr:GreA/GreB family elongation factor [Verrucomicrobiales bacterium]MDA7926876.1 GreA/GreB family elongation factor [Verrucomicrobiales bacterium]